MKKCKPHNFEIFKYSNTPDEISFSYWLGSETGFKWKQCPTEVEMQIVLCINIKGLDSF